MKLVLFAMSLITALFMSASTVVAQYGEGSYGGCEFGQNCPTPIDPPTVVEVPQTPANLQPGRAFSVNISENQRFSGRDFLIIVTPNFDLGQISRVILFQNGDQVAQSTSPVGESFFITWLLPDPEQYSLRLVVELTDGALIEQVFPVQVTQPEAVGADDNPVNEESEKQESSTETDRSIIAAITSGVSGTAQKLRQAVANIIEATPPAVAYSVPYAFLGTLGTLLLVLLLQTRNQLIHIATMMQLLDKDKQLADDKSNFIMLASHYIRTPLTIINGSIEMISLNQAPDKISTIETLKSHVAALQQRFEVILTEITQNKDLANITPPDFSAEKRKLYKSAGMIVPIVLSLAILIGINVVFLSAQKTQLLIPNVVLQLVLAVAAVGAFYILWNRRYHRKLEESRVLDQRSYELKLDQARNSFIQRAADELSPHVAAIEASTANLGSEQDAIRLQSSVVQLRSVVNRFLLTAQLERGKIQKAASQFAAVDVMENIINMFAPMIESKKLRISRRFNESVVWQNQQLLQYVLQNLLDNAVKYTPEGNRVEVGTRQYSKNRTQFTIRNFGIVIDESVMTRLFQPFTRAEVETFNSEGLGLGLYLSRLIARYLGGDVTLESSEGGSTLAKAVVPVKLGE